MSSTKTQSTTSVVKPHFAQFFRHGVLDTARIVNGIPRFTPDESYSTGNFSKLRERHAKLQLDSVNQTGDRRSTILERTQWPPEFFAGKTVLECGCGAGPDTEILLSFGAKVLSADLAGLDIARANIGDRPDSQFIQASIMDLPLVPESFDIVFCHRVLQHTPDPEATLRHILQFVKPGGAVFVHSYAHTFWNMFCWKYALRPVTRQLPPEPLYSFIEAYAPAAYRISRLTRRIPRFGRRITHVFVPFCNHEDHAPLAAKPREYIIELGVHNTFDALSPRYDRPLKASIMRRIAAETLKQPFTVDEFHGITLLRTVLDGSTLT